MDECARMSCDKEAVALLTFAPQQAKAWLYDLHEANSTGGIMLCRRHANATVVPMSWQLVDARDPAWPGRDLAGEAPRDTRDPIEAASDAALAAALPSDAGLDREFAALDGPLPVAPRPYTEPQAATRRAAGLFTENEIDLASVDGPAEPTDADMSLFQLPLADVPAVTPHPEY